MMLEDVVPRVDPVARLGLPSVPVLRSSLLGDEKIEESVDEYHLPIVPIGLLAVACHSMRYRSSMLPTRPPPKQT